MIGKISKVSLVFVLILALFVWKSTVRAELLDRVVAIVNDEIITLSELEDYRKSFYQEKPGEDDWLWKKWNLMEARDQALNSLIEEKLITQEANKVKITIKPKEVENALESIMRQRGMTQEQLEEALKSEGMTLEKYKSDIEISLKRTRLISQQLKSEIRIKEEDLRAYYAQHTADYASQASIRLSQIVLFLSASAAKDEEAAVLSRASDILKKAQEGGDFAELARQYSQDASSAANGGDMGFFKEGELIPPLGDVAFKLGVGEVGGPIRIPEGVLIIKVVDRKAVDPLPFEAVKDKVEQDYYKSEVEKRYRDWMKKLKEKSAIEVKL